MYGGRSCKFMLSNTSTPSGGSWISIVVADGVETPGGYVDGTVVSKFPSVPGLFLHPQTSSCTCGDTTTPSPHTTRMLRSIVRQRGWRFDRSILDIAIAIWFSYCLTSTPTICAVTSGRRD